MHIDWLDLNALDQRDVDGATAVIETARAADCPHELAYNSRTVAADLQYGWEANPAQAALARGARDRVVGVLIVRYSPWDNRHMAGIEITVDPTARRQGLGSRLFEAAVERVVTDGRTLVTASSWEGTPGIEFAKAMGMDRALEEVKRAQNLWTLDRDRLDGLAAEAAAQHPEYQIVSIAMPTPEHLLVQICEMTAAINDAPTDDLDIEDDVFTPDRIRAFERAQFAHDRRLYRLVAQHRQTGALAGHTMVGVEAMTPWHAYQFDTSVQRAHRGHRLGLSLKIAMLRLLAEQEPQVRVLETWNAASNDHMIAVNEALGYRVVARAIDWQKHL